MTESGDRRTYSAEEAASYARAQVAYCDRMMAEYPDAGMATLRARATAFLSILESEPQSLDRLRELHVDLVAGKEREGTGWFFLMSYVGEYVEHLEKGGS